MADEEIDTKRMEAVPANLWIFADRYGNTVRVGNAGHFFMPPFPIGKHTSYIRQVREIREMNIMQDDILVCSYPKAGLHWQYEIITRLLKNTDQMQPGRSMLLESWPLDCFKDIESPRLLTTHLPFSHIPRQAVEKKIKIVYLRRNPKDTMVSFYKHLSTTKKPFNFGGTFEQFVQLQLQSGIRYGGPIIHAIGYKEGISANPDLPVFVYDFETMKKNPVEGVNKLNDFLGTGCSPELCEKIAHACHINQVKADKEKTMTVEGHFTKGAAGFYRKGEIGDWKNWFTVAFNEEFEKEIEMQTGDYQLEFQYE